MSRYIFNGQPHTPGSYDASRGPTYVWAMDGAPKSFSPRGAAVVPHDLLEHDPETDDGSLNCEFKAFGCKALRYSPKNAFEPQFEATTLLCLSKKAACQLDEPPDVQLQLPSELDNTLSETAQWIRTYIVARFKAHPQEDWPCAKEFSKRALGWLRLGAWEALQRYEGLDLRTIDSAYMSLWESIHGMEKKFKKAGVSHPRIAIEITREGRWLCATVEAL